jgi:hypothetical protein
MKYQDNQLELRKATLAINANNQHICLNFLLLINLQLYAHVLEMPYGMLTGCDQSH